MTPKNKQDTNQADGTKNSTPGGTNYYEILEVGQASPNHEIHRAYQRARETYSQDNPALYSMFSPEEARELLRLIEEAFAVLSNPSLRRSYDESLAKGESTPLIRPLDANESGSAGSSSGYSSGYSANSASSGSNSKSGSSAAHLASVHQSLPDFAIPTAIPIDAAAEAFGRKREPVKPDLAPGMSRTSMSTYKVDDAFEAEINSTSDFEGQLLQRIRMYKNISLERMSESTRISRPYLTAMENNDYKSLPAAVFVRGFVTQVARNLGLDEVKTAASYMKRFKAGGGK